MRARCWRRCAALALCCLALALRLLLLLVADGEDMPGITSTEALQGREEPLEPGRLVTGEFAGAYMAERSPGNASHCRWQYGLPGSLRYLDQQLISSPEAAEAGGGLYRVLAYATRGLGESLPQLSLCSHATAEQAFGVVELARRWEGPVSLAVYAPGADAGLAVSLIERACRCEPAMAKVSVHLIFPREAPARLSPAPDDASASLQQQQDCSATELRRSTAANLTERRRLDLVYPINVARNVARNLAPTQRVLVSDVELLPSDRLASRFIAMLRGRSPQRALAFVLPVFEVEAGERPPRDKAQLLAAMRAGLAVYFHRFSCPHCQRFPGLTRWILRPDPGRVKPLIITRREYPHHRWEPIFIGTKHDPLYAEEMSWEGRQDKMTQMLEMCLMNYRLIVLDGAFLVHTPGIKRPARAGDPEPTERQRAHERQNARIYQRVTRRLLKRYPPNRRCRP